MTLVPCNEYVLCEKIEEDQKEGYFFYCKDEFPTYRILSIGNNKDDFIYEVNDMIVCNSVGTKVDVDGNIQYLFKLENIIGKVM